MPVEFNGQRWKLLYLDTNAISNFISNNNFRSNLFKKIEEQEYYICFSIYNAIELSNGYESRFERFLEIFSNINCIMFWTYIDIINEEIECYRGNKFDISKISYSFVPNLGKEYDIRYCLEKWIPEIKNIIEPQKRDMEELENFFTKQKNIGEKYVLFNKKYESETTIDFLNELEYNFDRKIDIEKLPTCRIINKSIYNRITCGKKIDIGNNDIYDIMISAVLPYVDAIVSEKYQLEVIKQAKRNIKQIQNIQCYNITDFMKKEP